MEKHNDVNTSKVVELFNERADQLTGINAVMSSSDDAMTTHKNKFRDFVTRKALVQFLQPNSADVVLDFGCGIGRLSKWIAPKVKQLVAVDISPVMIEKAKKWNPLLNGDYRVLNESDSFQPEFYTKIFTCWVFQHMDETQLKEVLNQFHVSLQNKGRVVILEQISKDNKMQEGVLLQRSSAFYISLFEEANFTCIQQRKVMRFPSYGMHFWSKYPKMTIFPTLFLWLEKITMKRKIETADYFSEVFIFEKN